VGQNLSEKHSDTGARKGPVATINENRFFNEQYLLACYLLGGANGDEIVFPSRYVSQNPAIIKSLDSIFKNPALNGIENHGGMCWMRKA